VRILHVGASGAVGSAAATALRDRGHELLSAHRHSAELPIDITDPASISHVLESVGEIDAVVSTAGSAPYGPWDDLDRDSWLAGLQNKLLGQVELVRQATTVVRPGGSFTLISGILAREPVRGSSIASAVNAALESWVRASAGELWGRFRINVVSPTVLTASREKYADVFPGFPLVDNASVGRAFVRSVESMETGQVYEL
jgi:NAD(P)-dependent dehydrogenase (short-subunit alcohol dehydrogenase family)